MGLLSMLFVPNLPARTPLTSAAINTAIEEDREFAQFQFIFLSWASLLMCLFCEEARLFVVLPAIVSKFSLHVSLWLRYFFAHVCRNAATPVV